MMHYASPQANTPPKRRLTKKTEPSMAPGFKGSLVSASEMESLIDEIPGPTPKQFKELFSKGNKNKKEI